MQRRPMELIVIPLPSPLTTPPVTTMYFMLPTCFSSPPVALLATQNTVRHHELRRGHGGTDNYSNNFARPRFIKGREGLGV
jgi:hypothetical protein